MKQNTHEHQIARRKVWSKAWVYTANANDCSSSDVARFYANEALKVFDRLFPEPAQNDNDILRRDLWADAFSMTANANNCKKARSAISFANDALDDYDKYFPRLEQKISLEKE